ncbi:O-antigen ligase family protein [Fusobacterium varium]|nr:O-antigen ligase family protein [Fusobacterium varium]
MKKLTLKKETINILFYMIGIFFINRFFNYEILNKNQILQKIYINFSRVIFLFILGYWLKSKIYKKDLKLLILMSIYFILILITTIVNNGSIRSIIMVSYPIIGTILLISIGIHKNEDLLIIAFSWLFYSLIMINFFDTILFKDTSSQYSTSYYFLGGKNQLAIPFSVGFCFIKIYYEKYRTSKLKFFLISYFIIIILTGIIIKSGTCIVSLILLLGLSYFKWLKKILTPFNFFIGYLTLFIGIIIFKIQNYFKFLIVDILHKDITFTRRTIIWEKVLEKIKEKPLLGYGMNIDTNYFQIKAIYPDKEVLENLSAHNQILHHLYETGIITTMVLALIYFYCCYNNKNNKNFIYFFYTIVVICITWLTEATGIYAIIAILTFCYYSNRIRRNKD